MKCPCCNSDLTNHTRPLVSLQTNKLLAGGEIVQLTAREAEMLYIIAEAMPLMVPYERIIERIYGAVPTDDASDTIKVYACRLRSKIASTGLKLRTIWGEGYALEYGSAA